MKLNLRKILLWFCITLVVSCSVLVGVRVFLNSMEDKTVFDPVDDTILSTDMPTLVVDENSPFYSEFTDNSRVNFLIVGLAYNTDDIPLSDTIMLVTYDTVDQTVDIISVPRDTYYYREGYKTYGGAQKINSIYQKEGVLGTAEAVSEILGGIPIHYYAIVEYDDIKLLVDAIGGVDIEVPFDLKYDDPTADPPLHIDIPAGTQHIDSSNVVELLRFRKSNYTGYKSYSDLGRVQMQQTFIKACIKKCLKIGNVTKLIKTALKCINSDIEYSKAIELAKSALELNLDNVNSHTVPTYSKDTDTTGGLSYQWIKDEKLYEMLEEIFVTKEISEETTEGAVSKE